MNVVQPKPAQTEGERVALMRVTEYLDLNPFTERWHCHCCGFDLGPATASYKCGCLVNARNPHEVHFPIGPDPDFNFSFDPDWMLLIEFYCPDCGTMVETEYLPPGHPLTWDIQLDLEALRRKYQSISVDDSEAQS
jgi:acetone carboxylase gamma subunit